jgi:hypothetical protein
MNTKQENPIYPTLQQEIENLCIFFTLRWLDIVITKILLKNREQNRVTIFITRKSRKLINKMKKLPK